MNNERNVLTINKTSWHFQIYSFIHGSRTPTNLCEYCRKTLGSGLLFLLAVVIVLLMIWMAVYPVMYGIGLVDSGMAFFVGMLWVGFLLFHTSQYYSEYLPKVLTKNVREFVLDAPHSGRNPNPKSPNIIFEYFKALKQKTCPLIKVV